MKETCNNCFGWKNTTRPFIRRKITSKSAEVWQQRTNIFRHSCLPAFAWGRNVLGFLDSKQLLRVSWILWYYFPKWYSIQGLFSMKKKNLNINTNFLNKHKALIWNKNNTYKKIYLCVTWATSIKCTSLTLSTCVRVLLFFTWNTHTLFSCLEFF